METKDVLFTAKDGIARITRSRPRTASRRCSRRRCSRGSSSALYLQLVLGYSPLDVGLAFLPATLLMGGFSLGLSAKVVMRWGIRGPLVAGLGCLAAGLLLFARAPVDGTYVVDVLPSMILLALGRRPLLQPVAARGDGRRPARAVRSRLRAS